MKRIAARRQDRFLFKRRLISVAVMSAVSGHAGANPTGPQVVNGQVTVGTQGSVLTVTNSPSAIVNWQSFSIGSNETTRFVQQSAASAVLNRVVGVDPSAILGTLQSNGKVFLINTNGILFGQGARVDVAGLVASTLNLNDADFLQGRLNFQSSPLSSSVVNRGTIATPEGGSVFLVGAAVENSGIIHAPGGEVILAAGQTVRLGSTAAPNVLVEVEAPANRTVNLGEIAVGAGKAGIYGGFVEQKGIVSADTATVNPAGKIVFKATRDTTVAAASVTSAGGAQGGLVTIESGGTTFVEGVVSAMGARGTGGKIQLVGNQVAVTGGAVVDASGAAGGGTILVGGDYKGGNADVVNARATFVGGDTVLRADANGTGDGGRIIVWSDEVTRAYGRISARGGPLGGGGGFVETSSRGFLDVLNAPDITAPLGRGGTWLLDPYNITVVLAAAGSQSLDLKGPDFRADGDNSTVSNEAIQNALNVGGVVLVNTDGAGVGTQAGDITVDAPIAMTGSAPATLHLLAANNIYLTGNANISSSAGALSVILNSDRDGTGGGAVWMQSGSRIFTNGGEVVMGGGGDPRTIPASSSSLAGINPGVLIQGTVLSGAGNVTVLGRGNGTAFEAGVTINPNGLIESTSGGIVVVGSQQDLSNAANVHGVLLYGGGTIRSATGTISIRGTGPGTSGVRAVSGNTGVILDVNSVVEVTGAGHILIEGDAGFATNGSNSGVRVTGGSSVLADGGGSIAINGTPGDPGDTTSSRFNNGVAINSTVRAGGTGSITIVGSAATGLVGDQSQGVTVQGAGALVEATGAATISITGTGSNASNTDASGGMHGVFVLQGGRVKSESGNITVSGTGGLTSTTASNSIGVSITGTGSSITTTDGAIHITGIGGGTSASPAGINTQGVYVQSGALVEATGTGSISIAGIGGATGSTGAWAGNSGVSVNGGSQVKTAAGSITIDGQGGLTDVTSSGSRGVEISDAGSLISSVDGVIEITGVGGGTLTDPTGQSAHGIALQKGAVIQATGTGSISISGTSGATAGIFDPNNKHFFSAGAISSYSHGVDIDSFDSAAGSRILTNGGSITIVGNGAAILHDRDSVNVHGVFLGGAATAVQSTSGSIAITGTSGGTAAGHAGGDNVGVVVFDHAVVATGGGGTIQITGTAGASDGGISIGVSIYQGSSVTAHDGNVTLRGTGSISTNTFTAQGDFANGGVEVGSRSSVQTTGAGSILLDGIAGSAAGGGNRGVAVFDESLVEARGTGSLTLHGILSSAQLNATASAFVGEANNGGVWIANGSTVRGATDLTTDGGAITVTGLGPLDGSGAVSTPQLFGVRIENGSTVESVAGGAINLSGDLRDSRTAGLQGVHITGSSSVLGNAGNVSITGIGGGANRADADGVLISGGAIVATSSGAISVTGSLIDFPNPDGMYLQGVTVAGGAVRTTAGGSIVLDGSGPGTAAHPVKGSSSGMAIVDGGTIETLAGGDITLVGTGGFATHGFISGVYISSDFLFVGNGPGPVPGAPVRVSATGTGKVTITGFLGSPGLEKGTDSAGVSIQGFGIPASGSLPNRTRGATVTTENGALTITGYGPGFVRSANPSIDEKLAGAGDVQGVYIADDASVGSKGSGAVRIQGDGGVVRGYCKDSFVNPGTPVLGVDATGVTIETSATVFSTSGALDVVAKGGYSNSANADSLGFPVGTVATESAGAFIANGNSEFPTTLTSTSGNITIAVTGPGTLTSPIGAASAATLGFGYVDVSTGSSNTIAILGDGGATNNGYDAAVFFHDGTVNFAAGAVNLFGNTVTPAVSTNKGSGLQFMPGVEIDNSHVTATGTLAITGVGGNATKGQNYGVWIHNGSTVSATSPAESISITGTGGGSGSSNSTSDGINIDTASAITAAGNVALNGTGAGTAQARAGSNIAGVRLSGGSTITSTGASSSITVTGVGGFQTGSESDGVSVEGAGSAIRAPNGSSITIIGNAGDSDLTTANTAGALSGSNPDLATWDPTGLEWSGFGVRVINGGSIASSTGDISITGTGGLAGTGSVGKGFWGAGIEFRAGASVSTDSGNMHLEGTAPGDATRPMGRNTWGVHIEEAATVTSKGASGGSISIMGTGTFASGMFDSEGALGKPGIIADASGVELHAGAVVSTVVGNITITGTTAHVPENVLSRIGVAIGEAAGGVFSGVCSETGSVIVTGSVPTALAGFEGASGLSDGVLLYQGGYVQTDSGAITIAGVAGEGSGGGLVGVELFNDPAAPQTQASRVISTNGNVLIIGTGGTSSGAGSRNVGVSIGYGSMVSTGGTGSVAIRGTGGVAADGENHGVWIHDASTVSTAGATASILITGTGGPSNDSDGINIDGASTTIAAADVTLLGTRGTGSSSYGVHQIAGAITAEALTVSADGGIGMAGENVLDALTATNATAGNLDIRVKTRKLAPIGDVILNDIVNSGPGDVNLTLGKVDKIAYGMTAGHSYSAGGAFNVDHAEMLGVTIKSVGANFIGVSISGGDNVFDTGATSIGALTLDSASTPQSPVTLRGASALTIAGEFAWYDGRVANTGGLTTGGSTSILRMLPDGVTPRDAILDTNWSTLPGSITQYDGSGSGNFIIQAGRTITNAGQFLIDPVGTFTGSIQGSGATFVNQGRLAKQTDFGTQMDMHVVNDGGILASTAGTFQITDLTLQGAGTVQGTAPVIVPGTFAWTGGTIAAGSIVSANGTGSISAGAAKTLDGTLVNNGTFALQDNLAGTGLLHNAAQMDVGSFTVQPAVANDGQLNILAGTGASFGSTLSNSQFAAIDIASNDTANASLNVTGDVTNDGAINLTAGGAGATSAGFGVTTGTLTNNGTIHSLGDSGTLFNRLTGNIVNDGAIDVTDSLRMDNAGFRFTNAGSITIGPSEQLFINGGAAGATVDLNTGVAIASGASLRLGHVAVNGPANISNSGTLDISANTDIEGPVANNVGGVMQVRSLGNSLATLSNDGIVSVIADSGLASLDVGAGFTNTGTIEVVAAGVADGAAFGVASGTLVNAGTLRSRALAGTGKNGFDAQITNTGLVDIAYSAGLTNQGKTFDTSNGTVNVASGQTLTVDQGPFQSPTPGTLVFGTGTSLGTGTGVLSLLQGTLKVASDTTIGAAGATLAVNSTDIPGTGTLTNLGSIKAFTANNNVRVPLVNQGTITVEPGAALVMYKATTNTSSGRFNVWASDSGARAYTALWVDQAMDNAGTIELRSDASLGYTASLILSAGAVVNNSGTIHTLLGGPGLSAPDSLINPGGANGRINNTGTLLIDNNTQVALATFDTSSGTVDVASGNTLTLTGAMTTSASTILRVQPGSQLTVSDGFVNNGLIDLQRSGASNAVMIVSSSSPLSNAGTIRSTGAGTGWNELRLKNGDGTPSTAVVLENQTAGVIRADADLLINHFDGRLDLSQGTLDAAAGQTLQFANYANAFGANLNLGPLTQFGSGTGYLDIYNGTLTLTGNLTLPAAGPKFLFRGTSIDGPGFTLTNDGQASFNSETVNVTVVNNGSILLDAPRFAPNRNVVRLQNALTANAGSTIEIDGGAQLDIGAGFTNQGTIKMVSSVAGTAFDGATLSGDGTLTNEGTVQSLTGGGTQHNQILNAVINAGLIDATFDLTIAGTLTIPSAGTVQVKSGTLTATSFPSNSGTINVAAGATFSTNGQTLVNASTGTIGGTGTISVGTAGLYNSGRIAPGPSPGTLTIAGDLTLTPDSVLEVVIEGPGAGQYDVVSVTGTVTLDGMLNALFRGGYQGAVGDKLQILAAGTVSGRFANVSQAGGLRIAPDYSATAVVLDFGGLLNEWIGGSGLWTVASNWSLNTVPTAAHDVVVNINNTLATVTIPNGSDLSLNSLLLGENLLVETSTLHIVGDLTINSGATLTLMNASIVTPGVLRNSGTLAMTGGSVVTGRLNNAGVATLRSGLLSVGVMSNIGTVSIDGGTVTATSVSVATGGQLRVLVGALSSSGPLSNAGSIETTGGSLNAGSTGNAKGGSFIVDGATVATGALTNAGTFTLQSGSLSVGAVSNSGALGLAGGSLTRAVGAAFGNSGVVNLNAGALTLQGGDGSARDGRYQVGSGATLNLDGGSYGFASLATAIGATVSINGASVSAGPLTNAGTTTLRSGSLSVGSVINSGTLNLDGGTFSRAARAAFGNSGTVNLNTGTLSLDGGDGGVGGGTYNLVSAATLRFTGGSYGVKSIAGAGSVQIEGTDSPVKLQWTDAMKIEVQKLSVTAGKFSASIDPPELTLDVPGGVTLTGGNTTGAYAVIQGGSVSLATSAITLTGGAGSGAYAGIQAMSGPAKIVVDNAIVMTPGTGQSSGAWMTATGPLNVTAVSCNGCAVLSDDPLTSGQAGLYGNPVSLTLLGGVLAVPSSVIVGVQTAQGEGEGDAILSKEEEEEEKETEQSADETRTKEEHNNEKPRQMCM